MNKALLFAVAASVSLGFTGVASAIPIAPGSTLSLNGSDSYTSTSITFANPASIGGESGSFAVLANCATCVTMIGSFNTGTGFPFLLYSATEGLITTTLSVQSDSFAFTPGPPLDSLNISGTGIATLTGFDATPVSFLITTQGPTNTSVTFSITTIGQVPLPAALPLFATGVGLLGFFGRRKLQKRSV